MSSVHQLVSQTALHYSPLHDLTPLHALPIPLPEGARFFGDKEYVSLPDAVSILKACGIQVIAQPRATRIPLNGQTGLIWVVIGIPARR